MEASITLKKVGKLIGNKTILAGLSFGIERGSLVAIVGLNDVPPRSNFPVVWSLRIISTDGKEPDNDRQICY